jgi:hypothetical protein
MEDKLMIMEETKEKGEEIEEGREGESSGYN